MSFTRLHAGYVIIVAQTPDAAWTFSLLEIDRCPETVNHAFSTSDLEVLIAHILDISGERQVRVYHHPVVSFCNPGVDYSLIAAVQINPGLMKPRKAWNSICVSPDRWCAPAHGRSMLASAVSCTWL